MLKKFLAITIIILLVGLGIIFYLKFSYKTPATEELVANKKSLHDLLLTPNEMCIFKISEQNTGTLYASDSNFRADFVHNDKGEITKSHLISDLSNVFLWFDGKKTGIRVAWPIVLDNSDLDVIAARILDLGIKVESQCTPWKVDNSKFELPDIEFKDFGEKIPGIIHDNKSTPEKINQCAACNNLDQKTASQCRIKLDCD